MSSAVASGVEGAADLIGGLASSVDSLADTIDVVEDVVESGRRLLPKLIVLLLAGGLIFWLVRQKQSDPADG